MAAKNFNIIIHMPKTAEGKAELEHRVAQLHAESVLKHVNNLKCPAEQKRQIIETVIKLTEKEKDE